MVFLLHCAHFGVHHALFPPGFPVQYMDMYILKKKMHIKIMHKIEILKKMLHNIFKLFI